jgi:protease IV
MASNSPGVLRRFFGFLWRAVDATRRFVVNVVFLLIVVVVVVAVSTGRSHPRLQEDTALVLNLKGDVVEQYTGSAREAEFAEALGGEPRETQLRDVVAVLDAAAKDAHVARAVLILDDMGRAGMAKLREIAAAEERFKKSGKQLIAWSAALDQRRYLLAAHASEAYLHPYGAVLLTGFGGYRNYYHDALEHIGVTVNVFRVGRFKSAVEPFINNAPSKDALEADAFWLNDAWGSYTAEVEAARHLPAGTVASLIADLPARLAATGGDLARFALDEKLVDGLKTRDELRAMLIERGKADTEHKTFRQVSFQEYRGLVPESGDAHRQVGVIVAEGTISDGEEAQGAIGGRSTAELIRKARDDDSIKAIVLRVDSPGGSAFGSELIRRELEVTRAAGKPVVVSMSDVAASGGYWISTAADRVFADSATVTGSIGVFGLFPSVDRTLDKLGIHTGGVTTAWPAGAEDLRRPIDTRMASVIQSSVGHIYHNFIDHVSQSRKMTPEKVNEIGQGRVWTGSQARERGLVDEVGGLMPAVHAAAELAKLGDGYRTQYLELEPKGWNRLLGSLPGAAIESALKAWGLGGPSQSVIAAAGQVGQDLGWITGSANPANAYVHCLCVSP